jgi:lysozyme
MPVVGFNGIIDISHYQKTPPLKSLTDAGIVAVVAKATQGRSTKDATYLEKKNKLKSQGMKWGSYHYSSGSDVLTQVENYLDYAKPEKDELMALDYEPSSSGPNMTYDQMVQFVTLIFQHTGRYPMVYGGPMLIDAVKGIKESVLTKCPLWYARYPKSSITSPIGFPDLWPTWTLWQYTDGNNGPDPTSVPGFGRCDRDTYNGKREDLLQKWPLT